MNAREDLYPFRAPNAVFVMGPTASGKSDFAFALALELGGTVISADSMQIYRGLDIGTAKETPERRAAVRHEMIDVADLNEEYSVARYREESTRAALDAIKRGSLPIFAGGTGLYFESLFYPLSFADTPKDEELRARLNEELETYGAEHMLEKLRALDPAAAERLHPNNTRRVIRAIEIALSGEKNMTGSADEKPVPDVIAVKFEPADRAELYRRIDLRTDKMMDGGLAEEIASLAPDFTEQSMQAIGYKEFAPYRDRIRNGNFRLTQAETEFIRAQIKQHTRNYAKRQLTWFRRYSFAKSFNIGDFEGAANYVKSRLNERGEQKGELL